MADAARLILEGAKATVVDEHGATLAEGALVVDLMPDATATDKIGASVRFVGEAVRA